MQTSQYLIDIMQELNRAPGLIPDDEAEHLVEAIQKAKKIFVAGAGRSGLMMRAFAMRLMHMGLGSYVVGETVTPGLSHQDVLIVGSGSGETKSLVSMAQKAKGLGAAVAVVTIAPDSTIGALADIAVKLPGSAKDKSDTDKTMQPMGSLFEQTLLLFLDAVLLRLMEKYGITSETMYGKHANLE